MVSILGVKICLQSDLTFGGVVKHLNEKIKADVENIVAGAMENIDAEYAALCDEFALATV